MPRPSFLLLCPNTLDALLALSVRDAETHLLTPVPDWIPEALFTPVSVTFGVYADETAVGLLSLVDPRLIDDGDTEHFQSDCLYVWRVMIDQSHRAQGYGTAALSFAKDYAQLIGLDGLSLTTKDRAEHNAMPLYRALGFTPSGRRLDGEIELVWRSAGSAQPPQQA